jgi:hypothetical protein
VGPGPGGLCVESDGGGKGTTAADGRVRGRSALLVPPRARPCRVRLVSEPCRPREF